MIASSGFSVESAGMSPITEDDRLRYLNLYLVLLSDGLTTSLYADLRIVNGWFLLITKTLSAFN